MKTSKQGLKLLIEREGKHNSAYLCSAGVPTIGVGHTGPEVHLGLVWSDEKVEQVFAQDIARFEEAINDNLEVGLKQHQFDALVSWLFNVGTGWASKATLMRFVNIGDFESAARQFDRWHIPPEIISRRNGEREQFKGTRFEARIAS